MPARILRRSCGHSSATNVPPTDHSPPIPTDSTSDFSWRRWQTISSAATTVGGHVRARRSPGDSGIADSTDKPRTMPVPVRPYPELLLRLLLIGYLYGITSERKLVEELRMHLAWRWFTGLGFDQEIPHHSTFSKNRHGRFQESKVFEQLFEEIVARCLEAGLVQGDRSSTAPLILAA